MAKNSNLNKAGKAKKDEFYTQLSDIENELRHYEEHFKDKVILCNCDDPYESNFFKYFAHRFNELGLKKLIATCYKGSPVAGVEMDMFCDEEDKYVKVSNKKAHKIVVAEMVNSEGIAEHNPQNIKDIVRHRIRYLKGDGDFRNDECIELLKQADIVVTNPPFSLFREYVAQLVEYKKKFIIIGNQNAITYKEFFPLLMRNEVWLGYGFRGNVGFFINTQYKDYAKSSQHQEDKIRVSGVMWYTNIDIKKRHEELILYKTYKPEDYPKYDNYDAIEVSKTADIPCDYNGVMGVPITFMDKYNPEQFEILGITDRQNTSGLRTKKYTASDSPKYNDLNARSVLIINNEYKQVYARILIRRKNNGDNPK